MKRGRFAARHWSLFAGIVLTTALQVAIVSRSPIIAKDGIRLINTAKLFAIDPQLVLKSDDTVPGYPALIVLGQKCAAASGGQGLTSWISGARLVSGLSGICVAVLLWLLTRQAFDTKTAGVAIAIAAVLPAFRENASDVLRDTPHLALYLLAAWFLVHGLKTGRCYLLSLALSGAASALAYWIRVEGLGVAAAGIGLLVLGRLKAKERRTAKIMGQLAALTLPAALLVLPSRILMPELGSRGGVINIPTMGWIERLLEHPVAVIGGMGASLAGDFAHSLRYVLLPVLALGLLAHYRTWGDAVVTRVTFVLFAIHSVLLAGFYLVQGYSTERYVLVLVALSIPWVAAGAVRLSQLPGAVGWNYPLLGIARKRENWILVLLVLALVAGMTPRTIRPLHTQRGELVSVARWLKGQAEKGDSVLSNSPYVPFYSEMPGEVVTTGLWGRKFEKERALRCRFAVFDTRSSDFDPQWLSTLAERGRPLESDIPAVRQGRIVVLDLGRHAINKRDS